MSVTSLATQHLLTPTQYDTPTVNNFKDYSSSDLSMAIVDLFAKCKKMDQTASTDNIQDVDSSDFDLVISLSTLIDKAHELE
eukprot:11123456-Ditylum_brightwellii.AAC.1